MRVSSNATVIRLGFRDANRRALVERLGREVLWSSQQHPDAMQHDHLIDEAAQLRRDSARLTFRAWLRASLLLFWLRLRLPRANTFEGHYERARLTLVCFLEVLDVYPSRAPLDALQLHLRRLQAFQCRALRLEAP